MTDQRTDADVAPPPAGVAAPTPTSQRHQRGIFALLVPAVLLLSIGLPCVFALLPATGDLLVESYQPLKTFKFFQSLGAEQHKWGPMPNFLYAPGYAVPMAIWYVTGDFASPSDAYPYGFTRPHEQLGTLVGIGRGTVLCSALLAVLAFGWIARRQLGRPWLICAALVAMVSSAGPLVNAFTTTKPDGFMAAFILGSMAAYLAILHGGLTYRRAVVFAALATCAVSCKELAAPLFIAPTAALLPWALLTAANRDERRQAVRRFVALCVAGIASYLVINVIYSPAGWLERMEFVFGPLKDPAVWASPNQTALDYAQATWEAVLINLGYGGMLLLGLAAAASITLRPKHITMAWLPLISHITIVYLSAGYMPPYFMLPAPILALLPVLICLVALADRLMESASTARIGMGVGLAALCLVELLGGIGTIRTHLWTQPDAVYERYLAKHAGPDDVVFVNKLWPANPGSSRLSYLGYHVDDRSLSEVLLAESGRPDLVLVAGIGLRWLREFRDAPARADYWQREMGFDYRQFTSFEDLGYERVAELTPGQPSWNLDWLAPSATQADAGSFFVYRLKSER